MCPSRGANFAQSVARYTLPTVRPWQGAPLHPVSANPPSGRDSLRAPQACGAWPARGGGFGFGEAVRVRGSGFGTPLRGGRRKPPRETAARARRGGWGCAPNPFKLSRGWGLELGTPYVCRSLCQGTVHTEFRIPKSHFAEDLGKERVDGAERPSTLNQVWSIQLPAASIPQSANEGYAPVVADCSIDPSTLSTPAA